MRARTTLLLLSALLVATALAGCGDDEGEEDESVQAPTLREQNTSGTCPEGTTDCDDTPGTVRETLPDRNRDGY